MSDLALAAAFAAGQQPAAEAYAPQRRATATAEHIEEDMGELPTIDDLEVAAAAAGVAPVPTVLAELGYYELGPAPEAMKEGSSGSEEEYSSSDEGAGPGARLLWRLLATCCSSSPPANASLAADAGKFHADCIVPALNLASVALQKVAVRRRRSSSSSTWVQATALPLQSVLSLSRSARTPWQYGSCCCRSRGRQQRQGQLASRERSHRTAAMPAAAAAAAARAATGARPRMSR